MYQKGDSSNFFISSVYCIAMTKREGGVHKGALATHDFLRGTNYKGGGHKYDGGSNFSFTKTKTVK